ncbi:TonB-dependent receptor [Chryseobacterium suipulveris]|uniref:TonB-dependent receptor n=1 Tax=Chryseobacterium suipulveris TaxID=2929800 RepID=A0ABY4BMJ6_9FLAO|nr:TonB-dependent receptor [Chryseobacterium suipulveris]UOE40407.1 TonB-dependent receptor [Chryseobacterium suipulveris]
MPGKNLRFLLLFLISILASGQSDSTALIAEITIDAYKKPTKFITSTKSVAISGSNFQNQNSPDRLLESINLLAGTRMEERSPGSYRLSVRGSTLRSPFGVRNIKVYLDDFILSDATGNTYLNLIDPELISKTEIYKGPESGDFGAVTGGTVLLKTSDSETKTLGVTAGSYGLFKENLNYSKNFVKHYLQVFQSYHTTDSYREQSAINRKSIFLKDRWNYLENHQLNLMFLFTDLHYETPGGLTFAQMQANRKQSRPATSALPGAKEQNAGIFNKTILAGISHQFPLAENLSHFLVVQGAYTDLRNPFITNYEKRFENNFALRTHLNFEKNTEQWFLQTRLGLETGFNKGIVKNYDNARGTPTNPQNFDEIKTNSEFVFLSQKADFKEKIFMEASLSLNSMKYDWQNLYPSLENGTMKFKDQWLPNFGISWLIKDGFSVRGKIGKGSSAPTSEEIRSSTQQINLELAPEYGWNKEIGIRKQFKNILFLEGNYFDFRLKDAIVSKQNENGQEYFVNAGGTVQKGFEVIAETKNFTFNSKILNQVKFWVSGSFYDFKFENYRKNNEVYSGNQITGTPSAMLQSVINMKFFNTISVDYSNFYTSKIYLNDANSVESEPSFVGNMVFRYPLNFEKIKLNFDLQIQNLYNTDYVLGYDINAFGGRYYNSAAFRNFNIGMAVNF